MPDPDRINLARCHAAVSAARASLTVATNALTGTARSDFAARLDAADEVLRVIARDLAKLAQI